MVHAHHNVMSSNGNGNSIKNLQICTAHHSCPNLDVIRGRDGKDGLTGAPGATGKDRCDGDKGMKGDVGPMGPPGPQGTPAGGIKTEASKFLH